MTRNYLNKYIIGTLVFSLMSFSTIFAKPVTLEKVEDLRLNMIEKRNKKSLVKLIEIYKKFY